MEKDIEGAEATEEASGELREREVRGFSSFLSAHGHFLCVRARRRSWWSGTLLGVLLMAVAASACGGGTGSGGDPMSVEEYAAVCGEASAASGDDATIAELSEVLDEIIRRMESVTPPREVSELHNVLLDYQRALKAALDDAPESDSDTDADVFLFGAALSLIFEYGPAISDATATVPPEARQQLVEAGCIDQDFFEDTDGSASVPVSSEMSLDDYAAACPQNDPGGLAEDATNGEVAAATERWIQVMESIQPPPEVAAWHWESLSYAWSIKDLADAQPQLAVANPFVFQTLLAQLDALKDVANSLDSDVRALLAEAGCLSEENASGFEAGSLPNQALASPSHATYAVEGPSTTVVSWDAVDGADHYNIYHDDFFDSSCQVSSGGEASFCEVLAANITDTAYTHTDPDPDDNYYWVTACNRHGCSQVDSENAAGPIEPVPSSPANLAYAVEGSTTVVSWDAVDGADHYNIYHDDFDDSSCRLNPWGDASFCEELAANITDTSYTHTDPDPDDNYYWVTACNRGGCSQIDSENPAGPIEPVPSSPANLAYAVEGSTTVVSWDAVDGADHYNIYHDDFHDSSCRLNPWGDASLCEVLATNITDTSYTHTDPDPDDNYYWVTACNRGGCSQIDSENPAGPIEPVPSSPANLAYAVEGSTTVVSWDAVDGADHYNIYHDYFFSSSCSVRSGGASFCEELAANITDTAYTHTDPDPDDNYYWVTACNRGGCSQIDSENPATRRGDR